LEYQQIPPVAQTAQAARGPPHSEAPRIVAAPAAPMIMGRSRKTSDSGRLARPI
jgi:hypothetical protein